jgi:hypothetical protein
MRRIGSPSRAAVGVPPACMCSPRRPRLPTGDETNWFSLASAIRVYRHFLELDTDHDGMLTPDELASYGDGLLSLTPAFVSSGL